MTKIPMKSGEPASFLLRISGLGFDSDFGLRASNLFRHGLIAFLCLFTLAADTAPDRHDLPGWKLVWADEFDHPGAPDPAHWIYETGYVRNNEAQYYTKDRRENVRVENGELVIEARHDSMPLPNGKIAKITSGAIETRGKASWKYGRIEVRAKIPQGRGTWPAIWMMPDDQKAGWPTCGEIDVMEAVGFEPDVVHETIHTKVTDVLHLKKLTSFTPVKNLGDDFHTYAVQWDAMKMEMFIDDHKYLEFDNDGTGPDSWPFDKPFNVILNLAIGGEWGGIKGVDDSIFQCRMEVDYVRAYRRE